MSSRDKEKVESLVNTICKKGILLVAVDFDKTLISFHSGGVWKDSVDKLVESVRPCMKDLMDVSIDQGLHVCIATYFTQSWVIKDLLGKLLGRSKADNICVQTGTFKSDSKGKHANEFLGKEAHLAAVVSELHTKHRLKIKPEDIILFDDSKENVDKATESGHWAIQIREDVCYDTFEEFAWQISRKPANKSKH